MMTFVHTQSLTPVLLFGHVHVYPGYMLVTVVVVVFQRNVGQLSVHILDVQTRLSYQGGVVKYADLVCIQFQIQSSFVS